MSLCCSAYKMLQLADHCSSVSELYGGDDGFRFVDGPLAGLRLVSPVVSGLAEQLGEQPYSCLVERDGVVDAGSLAVVPFRSTDVVTG